MSTEQTVDETVEIPLEKITWPDKTDITPKQIQGMATSLLVNGLVEAIVVAPAPAMGLYRGIVGRLRYEGMKHRWRASPEGKTILARIHTFKGEAEVLTWQLVENVHRRELPAMQKAQQYRALFNELRKESGEEATLNTLATAIEACTGNPESVKTIQHYLSLTKLEPETQEVLTRENLSLRHGLELITVKDPKQQVKLIKDTAEHHLDLNNLHWRVQNVTEDERRKKFKARLEKKAKELRLKGTITFVGESWTESKKYKRFYGELPKQCQDCLKRGVLLAGNFQQNPICTDPACYEKIGQEKAKKQQAQEREHKNKFDVERAKIYSMPLDVRHWRLMVYGLIEFWDLAQILKLMPKSDVVWAALKKLDESACQQLLVRHALEEVLTEPGIFTQGGDAVKRYVVKEFGLTPEVFLSKEDEKQ